jgi:SagB-type dehydrogenase family enzyme
MAKGTARKEKDSGPIELPPPGFEGKMTLEAALNERRSVRSYRKGPLPLAAVSQLLWAAQGVTDDDGNRTTPSSGGTFPLALYLVAGDVDGLPAGLYRYEPSTHMLSRVADTDLRRPLAAGALDQAWVAEAPASLVLAADYDRTSERYGDRGVRYVDMEAGHAAQNVHLQAVALGLGSVPVGAFNDRTVQEVLDLPENEEPLYILPVGRPK